jgi:hypothetical protein
MKSST